MSNVTNSIIYPTWFDSNHNWETFNDQWEEVQFINYKNESRNVLYSAGEYLILGNSLPYQFVKSITGITELITDNGIGTILKKEFRYSIDSVSFSEFQELTTLNLTDLGSFDQIWFQFRYILMTGGPVTITKVEIVFTSETSDQFNNYSPPALQDESRVYAYPITYKSNFSWDPYKMNRAVRLYKDLNLMVNNLFGHDIQYYRVLPQGRSKDVFLMEYSLYDHDDATCVKVIVPDNAFPDNKLNMGPFGVDYELPFEVQIDREYFQKIFGDGSGPQKRDVLYFPRTNRIYEISSSYLFRDFMNEPLYFKVTLIKWVPKSNVEQSESLNSLEDYTVSAGKLFGDLIKQEEVKITNPEQFTVATSIVDPVRSYLSRDQDILTANVLNYYTVVSEHQYKMDSTLTMKKIKTTIDSTYLTKGQMYYVRVNNSSTQPDLQNYYSMKKLTFIGIDDNFSIFSYEAGSSQLESQYPLDKLLFSGSAYFLYATDYTGITTEDTLASCDCTHYSYRTKVVKYLAENNFTSTEDRAFSAWFKLTENVNAKIQILSFDLDIYTREITVNLARPYQCVIGDTISFIKAGTSNFAIYGEVSTIISNTSIKIKIDQEIINYVTSIFPSWKQYNDLFIQKSYSRVFLNSLKNNKGIKIELYENRHFKITINDSYSYYSFPNDLQSLQIGEWYAIFINMSNTFKQFTINVWKMQWSAVNKLPATTDLRLIYNKTVVFPVIDRSSECQYFIEPSNMELTNIRLFNKVAETDKQPLILNQNIVKDAHLAIIIDNALPVSKLPLIGYTR